MRALARLLRSLPLLLISPVLLLVSAIALLITDVLFWIRRPRMPPQNTRPRRDAVSIVIPNWNGRHLLERYLPSVVAAARGNPSNEIIVVDNGSTDGSAELVRQRFPGIRLLALPRNLGFGGGCNAGVAAATNDLVLLLNSDMRVDPGFLQPLLEGFTDDKVFSVSCQIFFSDPVKVREETGLTEGWWENGSLRVRHRIDEQVSRLFPCFYGGGGSTAFDRRKFLELGGFDSLFAPFYLEDTDLGYQAWKRGWKVLYEPRSRVFHEHRGTIGRSFTADQIQCVLQKNFILFCWKNIHEWPRLISHFAVTFAGALITAIFGNSPGRASLAGLWKAFCGLPSALRSRWRARRLALINDTEAFRRPLGGYFRDRFLRLPARRERLRVLFVSPYRLCPPDHGGGVFMLQTCHQLARLTELHLLVMVNHDHEIAAHTDLIRRCASAEFVRRNPGQHSKPVVPIVPHAVSEFASDEMRWRIHRKIFTDEIDVLQLEYMPMGQYLGHFGQLACILFEHDVYFQSVGRILGRLPHAAEKIRALYEYMRALHYELHLLPQLDRVQVCSPANADYLAGFLPTLRDRLDDDLRAGIDVGRYQFQPRGREPLTMLFVGSFRHRPNVDALGWLLREVLPRVLAAEPKAKLIVVGSDPPATHSLPTLNRAVELRGFVPDVREPLARYSVFVCPILSGSGIRVKLLEAFAAGIPAVSTRLGAEGLTTSDGDLCALADDPAAFACKILDLFHDPAAAAAMAARARTHVETRQDIAVLTRALVDSYTRVLSQKRSPGGRSGRRPA